ncbi:MAG: DEAD/DEAH box helicase [Myxococcota bacterium]
MTTPTLIGEQDRWRVDERSLDAFVRGLAATPTATDRDWFQLRRAAEALALSPGFDRLIALDANAIEELPHQIDVALRVLAHMGGRAILADEVGLGKTIEAGIILKELAVRGLARRILILTPAALVEQWQGELESKFLEEFDTPTRPEDWHRCERAIASYHRAIGEKHAQAILQHRWDLVIVDEAHKVKNHTSKTYQFLQKVERDYLLLLTATPLQNDLRELYNLVTLLRPGQLGTWREFQKRHLHQDDRRRPRDPDALRELTAQTLVRTRRASVTETVHLPPRRPTHPRVELSSEESLLYRATVAFLRGLHREGFAQLSESEVEENAERRKRRSGKGLLGLDLIRLCQRLCSSSLALAESLETMANGEDVTPEYRGKASELAAAARRMSSHAKLDALANVLTEHPEQVIVFSEHLPTLRLIAERVQAQGRPVVSYQGGLSREERFRRLEAFRSRRNAVFVSTRSGTEGLNLQFCNVLVNYELPWNPMVIEQRIGRIHRIGQTREAFIINLAAAGTIEAHVLELLHQKIRLFELVVGELDVILGEFGGAEDLEKKLGAAWLEAESEDDLTRRLDAIGRDIEASREAGLAEERLASEVAAEDNRMHLEREFHHLTIPARVRLAYGTTAMRLVRGVQAHCEAIALLPHEVIEAMHSPVVEPAEVSPDYGPLVRVTGVTGRGRAVQLKVQADRLPLLLVEIDADPLVPRRNEVGP